LVPTNDANIDEERERMIAVMNNARMVRRMYQIPGVGPTLKSRDGEGNPYLPTTGYGWRDLLRPVRELPR
jgi:hypothetical protein